MRKFPSIHLTLIGGLSCCLLLLSLFSGDDKLDSNQTYQNRTALPLPLAVEPTEPLAQTPGDSDLSKPKLNLPPRLEIKLKSGDNLSRIFSRHKLRARDLQGILRTDDAEILASVKPGQTITIQPNEAGQVLELIYRANPKMTLIATLGEQGYSTQIERVKPDVITAVFNGTITQQSPSLYQAGVAAGLTDNLIMQLADLFQWDISFALDLREGDVFKVIVERSSIGGQPIGEDRILGASFDNFGTEHVGLRYIDSNARMGYYTPEGASLRKAFLRDPVHFSHVSSSFNLRRKHPIHNRTMPHRGIDYAANRGTPVRAAGEGKILKAERNEASGNFIVVRHGERYTTKYLHLSKFARGIKAGARVKQGQTIGYVGATGWATGPHLHYEFLVDGIHRNPRTVRLPNSSPVPERELASFKAAVGSIILALRQPGDSSLRMAQRSETNSLGD